jgi:hypothetical protein
VPVGADPGLRAARPRGLQLDVSPQWQVETDPELTSEVEVRFVPEGPDRTRVELEHRHLDRHGPGWQFVSDSVDGDQGWPLYLARYAALLDAN